MSRFVEQIVACAKNGLLIEPFGAAELRDVLPGRAKATYGRTLARRAVGSKSARVPAFIRISRGRYIIKPDREKLGLWRTSDVMRKKN